MANENWRVDAQAAAQIAKDSRHHHVQTLPVDLSTERTEEKGNLLVWKTGVIRNIRSASIAGAGNVFISTSPLATSGQHTGAQYLIPGAGLEYPAEQLVIGNPAQAGKTALIEVSDAVPLARVLSVPTDSRGEIIISGGSQQQTVKRYFDSLRRQQAMANPATTFGGHYSNRATVNINPGAGFNPNTVQVPAIPRDTLLRGKYRLVTSLRCWAVLEEGVAQQSQILSAEVRVNIECWVGGNKYADWGRNFYPQKTDFEFAGRGYYDAMSAYSCAIEPFEIAHKDAGNTLAENNLSFTVAVISWHGQSVQNVPLTVGIEMDYLDADNSAFA